MSSEPKPQWITTEPGQHEAFSPLSKEEAEKLALKAIEEAEEFSLGQGMLFATPDQKFLLDAEKRREHHKANAEVLARNWDKVGELQHLLWWAEAAIDLGKFDEAKEAIKSKRGRSLIRLFSRILSQNLPDDVSEHISKLLNDFKALPKFAEQIQEACQRPDTQECKCQREVDEDEKGNVVILDRRYGVRRIFSPYHNQIVTLYRCRHCGFLNASATPPERQVETEASRLKNEASARLALAANRPIPKGLPDAQVLKA